jgi:hypothetical protein
VIQLGELLMILDLHRQVGKIEGPQLRKIRRPLTRPGCFPSHGGAPRAQGRGGPGELMGGMAYVHAGIVQDQIADIDEVPVQQKGAHGFGHVAARLPAGTQAGSFQAGVEAQDANGDRFEPAGNVLPWQLRQGIGARHTERLVVIVPAPDAESVTGADWGAGIPPNGHS